MALVQYVCGLCSTLYVDNVFTMNAWTDCTVPYLSAMVPEETAAVICRELLDEFQAKYEKERMAKLGVEDEELGEEVCNLEFSLAYGGKVLLHNTRLLLHRGKKYGLLGHNGAGKTTLMRNLDNGKIEGMPQDLVSVFVESHFDDDDLEEMPVLEHICSDPMLAGKLESEVICAQAPHLPSCRPLLPSPKCTSFAATPQRGNHGLALTLAHPLSRVHRVRSD